MTKQGFVIVDQENRIFLGEFMGFPIWTGKESSPDIPEAAAFETEQEAKYYTDLFPEARLHPVMIDRPPGYASREACVQAGLNPW